MKRVAHRLASFLFLCCVLPASALSSTDDAVQSSGTCDQPPEFYSSNSFFVGEVLFSSPFDFSRSGKNLIANASSGAGTKKGDKLKLKTISMDVDAIKENLHKTAARFNLPIVLNIVYAQIENCRPDTSPPAVDVRFTVFASWFPLSFAPSFEQRSQESSQPAGTAGIEHTRLKFLPLFGYNHTTRVFGGMDLSSAIPIGTLDLAGHGSTTAHSITASQAGHYSPVNSWLQNVEWRAGYSQSETPTDAGRVASARLFTQFVLTSNAQRTKGVVVRFGAAVGGGYDQGSLATPALPPSTSLSNSAGEFKTYAGVSFSAGRQTFKLSYAAKLGQVQPGARIDFAKHVVDIAADFRLLPADHKPIDIETRFAAGTIQNFGSIPFSERFFGGNSEQNFIVGDAWEILSGPYIRSIPENRLTRLAPDSPFGGENFFSSNVTIAFPVWHRPLVPDDIRTNATFRSSLKGEFTGAQTAFAKYWRSKDVKAREASDLAPDMLSAVNQIQQQFKAIDEDSLPEDQVDLLEDCKLDATLANGFLTPTAKESNVTKRFYAVTSAVAKDGDGSVDHLISCLTVLKAHLPPGFADEMTARLTGLQGKARDAIGRIDAKAADAKASADLKFVTRTVNAIVDEVNLASIAPVLVFDSARIGPQAMNAGGGVRYGSGAGIRLSILDSIRFTAGYAVNPNPKSWEGRGAAFFKLELTSFIR